LAGSVTSDFQAATGSSCSPRAFFHRSSSAPRLYGYLTRSGLYKYQEYEIPRWQPRGSYGGSDGSSGG
jgi:hypothetical protein